MASTPAQRANAIDAIHQAARIYATHTWLVVMTSLMLQLFQLVMTFVLLNTFGLVGMLPVLVLALAVGQLTTGVYAWMMLELRHETVPTTGHLVKTVLPKLPALTWLGLLSSIGIGIGMVFLLLPGLWLAMRWLVAAPALVAGRLTATEALSSSSALTKQAMGSTFTVLLMTFALTQGVPLLTQQIVGPFGAIETQFIVQALVTTLFAPLISLTTSAYFFQLADVAEPEPYKPPAWRPGEPVPAPGAAVGPAAAHAFAPTSIPQPYVPGGAHVPGAPHQQAAPAYPQAPAYPPAAAQAPAAAYPPAPAYPPHAPQAPAYPPHPGPAAYPPAPAYPPSAPQAQPAPYAKGTPYAPAPVPMPAEPRQPPMPMTSGPHVPGAPYVPGAPPMQGAPQMPAAPAIPAPQLPPTHPMSAPQLHAPQMPPAPQQAPPAPGTPPARSESVGPPGMA